MPSGPTAAPARVGQSYSSTLHHFCSFGPTSFCLPGGISGSWRTGVSRTSIFTRYAPAPLRGALPGGSRSRELSRIRLEPNQLVHRPILDQTGFPPLRAGFTYPQVSGKSPEAHSEALPDLLQLLGSEQPMFCAVSIGAGNRIGIGLRVRHHVKPATIAEHRFRADRDLLLRTVAVMPVIAGTILPLAHLKHFIAVSVSRVEDDTTKTGPENFSRTLQSGT